MHGCVAARLFFVAESTPSLSQTNLTGRFQKCCATDSYDFRHVEFYGVLVLSPNLSKNSILHVEFYGVLVLSSNLSKNSILHVEVYGVLVLSIKFE